MLFAFEGTGMQWKSGGLKKSGLNDLSNTSSFVWRFTQYTSEKPNLVKYFPGPNVQGSNCDDIFEDAKKHYRNLKQSGAITPSSKINLVGYSRGAYIAMCFAKYLEINGIPVNFLAMFDPVSVDITIEGIIAEGSRFKNMKVPNNVKSCYQAVRSPITGSRKYSMNSIGKEYENGKIIETRLELPGSHAAIGGFPGDSGIGDSPTWGQGNPERPNQFYMPREITAWWESGNYISQRAFDHGLLKRGLVGSDKPPRWVPKNQWFTFLKPNVNLINNRNGVFIRGQKI